MAKRGRAGLEAEAIEDIGETGRIRSQRQDRGRAQRRRRSGGGDQQSAVPKARRRRRTRAGREIGGEAPEVTERKAS